MKITVTESMFKDYFRQCGRADQFSYAALGALFEYYEEIEQGSGEEMELDPVAICCDWAEYSTPLEAARNYSTRTPTEGVSEEDQNKEALEFLMDNTTVLCTGESYLVLSF